MESEYVSSILEESKFQDITIEGYETEVNMFSGRSLSDSVKDYISINPVVSGMLKESSENKIAEILNSAETAFSPYYTEKGLIFPSSTWLVTARK